MPHLNSRSIQPRGRHARFGGFTGLEMLIVLGILSVPMTLIVRGIARPPVDTVSLPCETVTNHDAMEALLVIWSAEHQFKSGDLENDGKRDYGNLAELRAFTDFEARLGVAQFTPESYAGHAFTLQFVGEGHEFFYLRARPLLPNMSGDPEVEMDPFAAYCKDPPEFVDLEAVLREPTLQLMTTLSEELGASTGEFSLEPLQAALSDPENVQMLFSTLDLDGDGRVALAEFLESDLLGSARSLSDVLFPGVEGESIGADADLASLLEEYRETVAELAVEAGQEDFQFPSLEKLDDPLAFSYSALGHRIRFGNLSLHPCGEIRRLPILLDSRDPVTRVRLGVSWDAASSLEVIAAAPGLDVDPADVADFSFAADVGEVSVDLSLNAGASLAPGAGIEIATLWVRATPLAAVGDVVTVCVPPPDAAGGTYAVLSVQSAGAFSEVTPSVACGSVSIDDEADIPVIICPDSLVVRGAAAGAVADYEVRAVDRCGDAGIEVVCDPPSGSTFPPGTTEVTCVATNAAGEARCTFTVTVERGGETSLLLRGDSNDDGFVDISDPVHTLNWLFAGGPAAGCLAATNVNGDAAVNIADPTYLLNHLFSGTPAPVGPYPDCGPIPAGEALPCEKPPTSCQ